MLYAAPSAVSKEKYHEQVLNLITKDALFQIVDLISSLCSVSLTWQSILAKYFWLVLQESHIKSVKTMCLRTFLCNICL